MGRRCPVRTFLFLSLLLGILGSGACERRSAPDGLQGVPLSDELRPAIEASRRSLAEGDRGDSLVIRELDRFYGLQAMLYSKADRTAAIDSLFALWDANPRSVLWPELAAYNVRYIGQSRCLEMFEHPGLPDTTTVLGLYLDAWRTIIARHGNSGFQRAYARREELEPWEQVWATIRLSWRDALHGEADQAAARLLDALPLARATGGWRLETTTWLYLVQALQAGDHLDDALHAVAMGEALASAVRRETGDASVLMNLRLMEADLRAVRHELPAAFALYGECVDSSLANGLSYVAGMALARAGIATDRGGDYAKGLPYYRRGLALARADGDSMSVQILLANLMRRHLILGDLDSSRVYLEAGERWIQLYPNPSSRARFPLIQAEYYAKVGDYAKVDSLVEVAVSFTPNTTSTSTMTELHLELIKQGMERGRPAQAYRSISVLDSLSHLGGSSAADRNERFDLKINSAEFYARQGQFALAVDALTRADSALTARPDPARAWQLDRERGAVAKRRGDLGAAEAAFRGCLRRAEDQRDEDRAAQSRLLLAGVLLDEGKYADVRELLSDPEEGAFGGRFRTRLESALLRGVSLSREHRFEDALRELERMRALCTSSSPPDLLMRLDLETGRAEAGRGDRRKARQAYASVGALLRTEGAADDLDDDTVLDADLRRDLAESMLDLAVGPNGESVTGQNAATALADVWALLPSWGAASPTPPARMAPNQLVYFVGREHSYRWLYGTGAAELRRLPGEAELLGLLGPVLADLGRPGRDSVPSELVALAEALGGIPVDWSRDSTLTIVPDGPLFAVPWCALQTGRAPEEVWLERGAIRLADAPSGRHSAASVDHARCRLLALGVDGSAAAAESGLKALHHAEREAREIVELWPAGLGSLRVGEDADWRDLESAGLARYDVIHIASHALIYQGRADRTTLMLAGASGDPLTSSEISRSRLEARLVFLSCCEAAESVRRGVGAGHAGLARSFLRAGAETVVAPSIRVDDEAAADFAQEFYRRWLLGASPAEALRQTQLDLRERQSGKSHPYYWAFYQAISR